MPIQRCTRNEESGWQWGDEGTCYLPSEEGSDEDSEQKAIDQAIAAGASPDEFQKVAAFAMLRDVELFTPGTHNSQEYTLQDIDDMVESSNACLPFILKSIKDGYYEGNESLNKEIQSSGKPIPSLINLGHQRYFKDIKEFLKDVSVQFGKAGDWVTANIGNVKDDLALMLQEVFNGRSVELIKELYNPLDGNTYRNVIRSIGFLPHNIRPAVSGQNPLLSVEYAADESGFVTLYSSINHTQQEDAMKDTPKEVKGEGAIAKSVPDATHQTLDAPVAQPDGMKNPTLQEQYSMEKDREVLREFQAQIDALQQQVEEVQAEKTALNKRVELAEQKATQHELRQEAQAVEMFCKDLALERVQDTEGNEYLVSQAFVEAVKPLLSKSDNKAVVEFSDETHVTARGAMQHLVTRVVDMAAKGALIVPVGVQQYQQPHSAPEETVDQQISRENILKEYGAEAKVSLGSETDEHKILMKAYDIAAIDDYKRILGGN